MKIGVLVEVDKWCMMVCHMTRRKLKVKAARALKFKILPLSKLVSCATCNGTWQVAADSKIQHNI